MQSTDWTEEHSKALRELLESGMSYSRTADAINAKFKTAYSRNAMIGRAKRMGLAGPDRPKNWPKPILSAEAPRLHKRRERLASESRRPMSVFESMGPVKFRCVQIDPRHLPLVDLEPGDCRYPYGGDEEGEAITFCGHPRRRGASYCAAHFYLTRGPDAAPERPGGTVSLSWCRRHEARTETDAGDHGYPDEAAAVPPSQRASARADPAATGTFDPPGRTGCSDRAMKC
jgi:GcrA cell cycle regulator